MPDDPSQQDWLIAALLRQIGERSPSAFQIPGTRTAATIPGMEFNPNQTRQGLPMPPTAASVAGGALGGGVMRQFAPPPSASQIDAPQQDVMPAPATPMPQAPIPASSGPAVASAAPAANPAQQPVGAPAELHPSLAVPATQASPGMSQVPQTMAQLDEWRKLMDAMQFARQGA